MATSLQFLSKCLDRHSMKYSVDKHNFIISVHLPIASLKEHGVLIRLAEDGELIQFIAPRLFFVKDSLHKGLFFQTALYISYTCKVLRFEYDPDDGEVPTSMEIFLENADFTVQQFDRYFFDLLMFLDNAVPRLQSVLATGVDRGDSTFEQLIQGLVNELPSECIDLLNDAIDRHRQK